MNPVIIEKKRRYFWGIFNHKCPQKEIEVSCEDTLKGLEGRKIIKRDSVQFLDGVIRELELFGPGEKAVKRWMKIQMAKIYLDHLKQRASAGLG